MSGIDILGGTLIGPLDLKQQSCINLYDADSTNKVTIKSPNNIADNYNITLPQNGPNNGQCLVYDGNLNGLKWLSLRGNIPPNISRSIYVTRYGSDNNTGSMDAPFASVRCALQLANNISSLSNPVCIIVGTGMFIEDNTVPLSITADGISLEGESNESTVILPMIKSKVLFTVSKNASIADIRLQSDILSSTAACFYLSGNIYVLFNSVHITNFETAIYFVGVNGATSIAIVSNSIFDTNKTAIYGTCCAYTINNCTAQGNMSVLPSNIGVNISGASAILCMTGGTWARFANAILVGANTFAYILSINFRNNAFGVYTTSMGNTAVIGCSFTRNNTGYICLQSFGAEARMRCISVAIDGITPNGLASGIAGYSANGGMMRFEASTIRNCVLGIKVGRDIDTNTTLMVVNNTYFQNNTQDLQQFGTSKLTMAFSTIDLNKVLINNSTNVVINVRNDSTGLQTIGKMSNVGVDLISVANTADSTKGIILQFNPSLYNAPAVTWTNPQISAFSTATIGLFDTSHNIISRSLSHSAKIGLFSETSDVGSGNSRRGWIIQKRGTDSELDFIYTNTEPTGQSATAAFTMMRLDGYNKNIYFEPTTKLFISTDNYICKYDNDTLKINGTLLLGNQTSNKVLVTDDNSRIVSSNVSIRELLTLCGVQSNVQMQINSKLNLSGGTLSGPLILPSSSLNLPAIQFVDNNTGIYFNNSLNFVTNSITRLSISNDGVINIPNLSNGVLQCVNGNIVSSHLSGTEISNNSIPNSKLQDISCDAVADTIVMRNHLGNFAANNITITGDATQPEDVVSKKYVDALIGLGIVIHKAVKCVATQNSAINGLIKIDNYQLVDGDRVLLTAQQTPIYNGIWVARPGAWTRPADFNNTCDSCYVLVTNGELFEGSSWLCSSKGVTIGNANITFEQFSNPVEYVIGTNIGDGEGQVCKKTLINNIYFKTIKAADFITITDSSDEIIIGAISHNNNVPNTLVSRDSSGNFSANVITANLIGSASNNLLKSGDTMLGTLTLPGGSSDSPSLAFGMGVGLCYVNNTLMFNVNSTNYLGIDSDGNVVFNNLPDGIAHITNNIIRSSLVTNDDISPIANISDTKLDTIRSPNKVLNSATTAICTNTPNTIVMRNVAGDFSANNITANLIGNVTGNATGNILKLGDSMLGQLSVIGGTNLLPGLAFSDNLRTGLFANNNKLSIATEGVERLGVNSAGLYINNLRIPGILHNSDTGLVTSRLITDADIDATALISETKIATITSSGKVLNSATSATSENKNNTIVLRDVHGNFSANTITANVIGVASGNVSKMGDTLTGGLNMSNNSISNISNVETSQITIGKKIAILVNNADNAVADVKYQLPINNTNCEFVLTNIYKTTVNDVPIIYNITKTKEVPITINNNIILASQLVGGIVVLSCDDLNVSFDTGANISAHPAFSTFSIGDVFKVLICSNINRVLLNSEGCVVVCPTLLSESRLLYFRLTDVNSWTVY